jgi:hypothetical protein
MHLVQDNDVVQALELGRNLLLDPSIAGFDPKGDL